MNYDSYEDFIVLSEEAKEKIKNMSENELNTLSSFLAYSLRKKEMELRDKFINESH
jgi:hypothetical protein